MGEMEVPVNKEEGHANEEGNINPHKEQQVEESTAMGRRRKRKELRISEEERQRRLRIFEKEIEPLINDLLRFATTFLTQGNIDDAYDLVQETLLRAFESLDTYKEGTKIKAWLYTIMRNLYINEYRKRKAAPQTVTYEEYSTFKSDDDDEGPPPQMTPAGDMRKEVESSYLSEEVVRALNKLPEEFRIIVLLADVDELKYEEIAKILGIPIGTVRSRLHRARRMLKKELKEYAKKLYRIEDKSSKD
ncbi:MAG: sigma-70 family RNA polymerase sigma factor [Chlorobi bacterium]|nr:sigma-70 family RNA polymerase sigma factor [Chlorobiota bacterium]